jgi:hypothetical protein
LFERRRHIYMITEKYRNGQRPAPHTGGAT